MASKGKARQAEHTPILALHSTMGKYLIYQSEVCQVGRMGPMQFQEMACFHAAHHDLIAAFTGIIMWDEYARWWALMELLERRKIVLYDSVEQAEQAMREVA